MSPFQTRFQRLIVDGNVALFMLGTLPLLCRMLVSLLPDFVEEGATAVVRLDEASLGFLLVLAIALRTYAYVASTLFKSTTEQGRRFFQRRWGYRRWLFGGLGYGAYLYLTLTLLPLWAGVLVDLGVLAIVVRYGRNRAKAIVEELAFHAHFGR